MGLLSRDHFWVITLPYSHCFTLPKEVKVKDANILVVRPLQGGVEEGGEGSKVCYNKASVCEEPSEHVSVPFRRLTWSTEAVNHQTRELINARNT